MKSFRFLAIAVTAVSACQASAALLAQPPEDASQWVCGQAREPSPSQIEDLCRLDRGRSLGELAPGPASVWELEEKNEYDAALQKLLRSRAYALPCSADSEAGPCGWIGDPAWRLTGPYRGPIGSGSSVDAHGAIRVFYSPEVVDWLCRGRDGELPSGASIVAETHPADSSLGLSADPESGCLSISGPESQPSAWAIMIRSPEASRDGWYWGLFSRDGSDQLPLGDASAVSGFFYAGLPRIPRVSWYPSGELDIRLSRAGRVYEKLPSMIRPRAQFGAPCLRCHASAESQSTFADLRHVLGLSEKFRHFPSVPPPQANGGQTQYRSPFSSVRRLPESDFEDFFGPLEVGFGDVWDARLPAETYDHVVAPAGRPSGFVTSDQCKTCHDSLDHPALLGSRIVDLESQGRVNLSAWSEWRASPMSLSSRDPFFLAHLQSEALRLPQLAECIEELCLTCHAPMAVAQFREDRPGAPGRCSSLLPVGGDPAVPSGELFGVGKIYDWQTEAEGSDPRYGALARDGVSCTVCHRLAKDPKERRQRRPGQFSWGPRGKLLSTTGSGPVGAMENAVGATPQPSEWLSDSAMCGSCHDALLPVFDEDGNQLLREGRPRFDYRQSTHLEWVNSRFSKPGPNFRSCGDCHMPATFRRLTEEGVFETPVASRSAAVRLDSRHPAVSGHETRPAERPARRHALHGINLFLNEVFQQFPLILGIRQLDSDWGTSLAPSLISARNSMLQMAEQETARVKINDLEVISETILEVKVQVENLAGHRLPTGTGIHRMFLEMVVEDASGEALWASGLTNRLGFLRQGVGEAVLESEQPGKNPGAAYPRHHQRIDRPEQVQIYQVVYKDSSGDCADGTVGGLTTSLLRAVQTCKDNRVPPAGYDPARFLNDGARPVRDLAELHGDVAGDPDYTDPARAGTDTLTYSMDLGDSVRQAALVRVTLYSQTIPPVYLQEQFDNARSVGDRAVHIERVYHIGAHLDTGRPRDDRGTRFLEGRKVKLSSARREF